LTAGDLWENWQQVNAINENGSHPCFYVIPSADQDNLLFGHSEWGGYYYFNESEAPRIPFPGSENVTFYIPKSWNGVEGPVTFSNIAYADNLVTLKAILPVEDIDYVTIADAGSYHAGDRFAFALVRPEHVDAPDSVVWLYDDEPAGAEAVTLTAGPHTVEARLTFADGRKEILTLEIEVQ
jgi:hypothetical protein